MTGGTDETVGGIGETVRDTGSGVCGGDEETTAVVYTAVIRDGRISRYLNAPNVRRVLYVYI